MYHHYILLYSTAMKLHREMEFRHFAMNCKSCLISGSKRPLLRHLSYPPFPLSQSSILSVYQESLPVLAGKEQKMEPIHMKAKNLLARNEVEMGPDHMTAKKFHLETRCTAKTKCRIFETNIPRKGITGPQSQFPHSCVCE